MLRSLAFNVLFFANFIVCGIAMLPALLLPRRAMLACAKVWARISLFLLAHVAGVKLELRGRIPPGALLVASKHQSALETMALAVALEDPTFILKRELMWIPFFGWYAWKAGMIPIDRGKGSSALKSMTLAAKRMAEEGRQIVIFPEGTRRPPGAPPAYKFGAAHLYAALEIPTLPVALDTGLFWRRRSFIKRPGTAVIEFLEPLPPGLPRAEVLPLLEQRIETATAALIEEAQRNRNGLPVQTLAAEQRAAH
jgi:1-acyl-sn-glycerol-3-phosphate acyltransferase